MFRYLLKRSLSGIVAFLFFTAILFFSFNLLIPYDYVTTLSLVLQGTEARDALREELGLNLPLWQQYFNWLGELARGNLGRQFTLFGEGTAVTELLAEAIPATLLVFISGALAAFGLGHWLGKISSWRAPRWFSGSLTFGSIALYTAFPPWLAFLLIYLFIERLDISPLRTALSRRLWITAPVAPATIMAYMIYSLLAMMLLLFLLNKLGQRWWRRRLPGPVGVLLIVAGMYGIAIAGNYQELAIDISKVAFLPFITFVLLGFGDTMLLMQSGMIDTRHEAYIQTARAKGLPERVVRDKHAAQNALLPVLSRFVINLPYLLTAIVIVEEATNWHGLGNLLFQSIYNQNTFIYMDILVIVGLVSLVARMMLDVLYAYLDPRIRFGEAAG